MSENPPPSGGPGQGGWQPPGQQPPQEPGQPQPPQGPSQQPPEGPTQPPPPPAGWQPAPPPPPEGANAPPPPPPSAAPPPPPPPAGGGQYQPPPAAGGYQPPPAAGGYAATGITNDSQAMLALILGILSIVCCPIVGPVAFFIGNSSVNRIRASNGMLAGAGLAQAGRILGIIGTVFLALGILWAVVVVLSSAGRTSG